MVLIIQMNDLSSGGAKTLEFRKSPVRVGRNHLNEISIQDGFISEYHGVFRFDDSGLAFTDLGSTNGTFFGGQRVSPKTPLPLADDARLVFGRLEFHVRRLAEAPQEGGLTAVAGELRPGGVTMLSAQPAPVQVPAPFEFSPPGQAALAVNAPAFVPPSFGSSSPDAPSPPPLPDFSAFAPSTPMASAPQIGPPAFPLPAFSPPGFGPPETAASAPPNNPSVFPAPGFAVAPAITPAYPAPQPTGIQPYVQPHAPNAPYAAPAPVAVPSMMMIMPGPPSLQMPAPPAPSVRASMSGFAAPNPATDARTDDAFRMRRILETIGDAVIELRRSFEEIGVEMGVRPLSGATTLHHARDGREVAEYLSTGNDLEARLTQLRALFREMADHQQNVFTGIQDSTRALVETLDPRANDLEGGPKLFNVGKSKTQWRDYVDRFAELLEGDNALQEAVFSDTFTESYGGPSGEPSDRRKGKR